MHRSRSSGDNLDRIGVVPRAGVLARLGLLLRALRPLPWCPRLEDGPDLSERTEVSEPVSDMAPKSMGVAEEEDAVRVLWPRVLSNREAALIASSSDSLPSSWGRTCFLTGSFRLPTYISRNSKSGMAVGMVRTIFRNAAV